MREGGSALQRRIASSGFVAVVLGVLGSIELGPAVGSALALVGFAISFLLVPRFERRASDPSRMPPSDVVRAAQGGREPTRREGLGFVLLLFPRGLALWLVWPAAVAIWVLRLPFVLFGRPRVQVRQIAGWMDGNLIAFLESTVLRPLFPEPTRFRAWSAVRDVEHGPSSLDLW